MTNQISGHCRQPLIVALSPAIFDCDVAALVIADRAQPLAERAQPGFKKIWRLTAKIPNEWHLGLRADPERQCNSRAAQDTKKISPPHIRLAPSHRISSNERSQRDETAFEPQSVSSSSPAPHGGSTEHHRTAATANSSWHATI